MIPAARLLFLTLLLAAALPVSGDSTSTACADAAAAPPRPFAGPDTTPVPRPAACERNCTFLVVGSDRDPEAVTVCRLDVPSASLSSVSAAFGHSGEGAAFHAWLVVKQRAGDAVLGSCEVFVGRAEKELRTCSVAVPAGSGPFFAESIILLHANRHGFSLGEVRYGAL